MRKVNSKHKLANTFDLCSKRTRLKIDSKKNEIEVRCKSVQDGVQTVKSKGIQGPVVQYTIHRINLYPMKNSIVFPNTYPLGVDLSG